jgi:hypothetical protein
MGFSALEAAAEDGEHWELNVAEYRPFEVAIERVDDY